MFESSSSLILIDVMFDEIIDEIFDEKFDSLICSLLQPVPFLHPAKELKSRQRSLLKLSLKLKCFIGDPNKFLIGCGASLICIEFDKFERDDG